MTQQKLCAVLLKVLGVLCIVKAVDFVVNVLDILVRMLVQRWSLRYFWSLLPPFLGSIVSPAALLLVAFLLLRYGQAMAARMFPADDQAFPEDANPTQEWHVLAFTVMGVALLVWYVPTSLAHCLFHLLWPGGTDAEIRSSFQRYAKEGLTRTVLQLGLGLHLVLGARPLAALVRRMRGQ